MDETTPLNRGRAERRVLAGRYVLRGLLGSGGMADVELAHDEVLDRQVAVKILHARYSDDPSFIERFRREARIAASLNHPNMVAVYDTGESDGRPFIVMEYVAGRTLRDVLRTEGVLPSRALEIAREAALALHAAHERGLIHRDVKPGNIMIADDGMVKVTDFGIARAMHTETVTQTAAVFGTAAYIAPEQAQGAQVDARTDVYALGCVLYEMLTGRQPFAADSAVALAYKHISEPAVPPTRLNPKVTAPMEAVVLKAMAKAPAERYATARAMADDISRVTQGQATAATSPGAAYYAQTQALQRSEPTVVAPPPTVTEYEVDDHREDRTWAWLLLLVVLLGGLVAAYFLFFQPDPQQLVEVPDVTGRNVERAQQILRREGFEPEVERESDPDAEENTVLRQSPEPGEEAEEGSTVVIVVSQGPELIEVPRLEGLAENEAVRAIQDAGLTVGERVGERSDEFRAGRVIRSDPPAGDEVEEGKRVDYVVSEGPATVVIPNVRGQNEDDARATLRNASCETPPCLDVDTESQYSDDVPAGAAIGTSPAAGERVEYGSTVVLVLSQGPEPTEEPPPPTEEPEPTDPPVEPSETILPSE